MAGSGKRGGGDRVLESRHLVGLFLGVVLLCGVFFTLGYVMGRTQYGGAVHAADGFNSNVPSASVPPKSKTAPNAKNATPAPAPDNGGWGFYDNKKSPSDHLEPAPAPATPARPRQKIPCVRSRGSHQIKQRAPPGSRQDRGSHAQATRAVPAARAEQKSHRPASSSRETATRCPRNGRCYPTEKIPVLRRHLARRQFLPRASGPLSRHSLRRKRQARPRTNGFQAYNQTLDEFAP